MAGRETNHYRALVYFGAGFKRIKPPEKSTHRVTSSKLLQGLHIAFVGRKYRGVVFVCQGYLGTPQIPIL
jgi:hypothetical protein